MCLGCCCIGIGWFLGLGWLLRLSVVRWLGLTLILVG